MIDPRREAIFTARGGLFEVQKDVDRYERRPDQRKVDVVFNGRPKVWSFHADNVHIASLRHVEIPEGAKVEVRGSIWGNAIEVLAFRGPRGEQWRRVFYRTVDGDRYVTYLASEVHVITSATAVPFVADVLRYWRDAAKALTNDPTLQRWYDQADFVHPDSALASYLAAAPIGFRPGPTPLIFPFHCNISQRTAVETGLSRRVSVIEGPPGTGKTETILNLVANIVAARLGTVGVVSHANAAVDNVRDKLDEMGVGHVVADLGRQEKREKFFAERAGRRPRATAAVVPPDPVEIAEVDRRIRLLQAAERERAEVRQLIDAHRLERRHFEQHLDRGEDLDLERLPLLRRSSDRIVDFLVESELEHRGVRPGLVGRIRKYFRYGSLRGVDPDDVDVVLRLQRAYYDKRITELEARRDELEERLRRGAFDRWVEEHHEMSLRVLGAALAARAPSPAGAFSEADYKKGGVFPRFVDAYPVLLSTCHSLPSCLPRGHLLDYLILDEASQVNLLEAGTALSCGRQVIVVGDQRQLPPIVDEAAGNVPAPASAFDYARHSLLSSLVELYGDRLPRTLLREHYRCDPAIIGFCNRSFYADELLPFTVGDPAGRPMAVVRTVAGNHMRQHRGGGRSNQREVDVIREEVIGKRCAGFRANDIGVTTPYRRQVDKVTDAFIDEIEQVEADTVHKYQGRQKPVMILTTVLSETRWGRTGTSFVDDPHLVNVAVSRAVRKFILVINNDMMPTSRNIRNLVDYIKYHNPDEEVVDSGVVSVFDLLYRTYSRRLDSLAARLQGTMEPRSEEIIWIMIHDVLTERGSAHLTVVHHVLLRNLLPDLTGLTERQEAFVRHRASVDFVVYNRVSNRPLLAVEVDGFAFHENNPVQWERDEVKNEILRDRGIPLLRLATTGSGEHQRLRQELDRLDPP